MEGEHCICWCMFVSFSYDSAAYCISCMYLICNTNRNVKTIIQDRNFLSTEHICSVPGFTSGCLPISVCWDKDFTFTIQFVYRIKKHETVHHVVFRQKANFSLHHGFTPNKQHRLYRHYLYVKMDAASLYESLSVCLSGSFTSNESQYSVFKIDRDQIAEMEQYS